MRMQREGDVKRLLVRKARSIARRPGALAACALAAVLAIGAASFGFALAGGGGSLIERSGTAQGSGDGATREPIAEGSATDSSDAGDRAADPLEIVVDVGGAVRNPSVVRLTEGARVADAILAAGGLADDADASGVNQAALVADGQKVLVPRVGEAASALNVETGSGTPAGAQTGLSAAASSGLVNINSASADQLDALPGVGPSTAQAIIEDRERNGPFKGIEDLMRVSGIGEKKFEKLRSSICV